MASENVFEDDETIQLVDSLAEDPTVFVTPSAELSTKFLRITKQIFDYAVQAAPDPEALGPLPELTIEGFDNEQVWGLLELQNEPAMQSLQREITDLHKAATENKLTFMAPRPEEKKQSGDERRGKKRAQKEDSDDSEEEEEEEEEEEKPVKKGKKGEKQPEGKRSKGNFDDLDDLDLEDEDDGGRKRAKKARRGKPSQVDDQFFKLSEMSEFLDKMDREEEKAQRGEESTDDDDDEKEEEVDLFGDPDELVESEDEEDDEHKTGRDIAYEDFFEPPSDDEGAAARKKNPVKPEAKKPEKKAAAAKRQSLPEEEEEGDESDIGFDGLGEEEGDEEEEGTEGQGEEGGEGMEGLSDEDFDMELDGEEEEEEGGKRGKKAGKDNLLFSDDEDEKDTSKSTFEKKQANMKKKLEALEEENLRGREWQLMGEANVKTRPKDSALDGEFEFETTMKPAPVITQEMTMSLEDMIRQRIKDEAWDDVERKAEQPATEWRPQKVELDHEKSKKSLAEVYEDDYMQQVKGVQKEENPELKAKHEEIAKMFKDLCHKLDALSNFHYTPALPKEEIEVVANVPAIQMEEVLPLAVSNHRQLAPEEVYRKKKAEPTAAEEKTETDKNRARRQKKKAKGQQQKEREKRQKAKEKANPGGSNLSKKGAMAKITSGEMKNVNVIKDTGDTKSIKSSTAFFSKLQEEARGEISGKKPGQDKKQKAKAVDATKFKL